MALADRKAAGGTAAAETPYPENAVKKAPAKKNAAPKKAAWKAPAK